MATATKPKRTSLRVRVLLLDALDAADRAVTARELHHRILDPPTEATVRRGLADLVESGEVQRRKRPGALARFST